MTSTVITTAATILGIVVGSITVWFTMKDRMTEEISSKVKMETKIARLDERVKQLESQIWTLQTQPRPTP